MGQNVSTPVDYSIGGTPSENGARAQARVLRRRTRPSEASDSYFPGSASKRSSVSSTSSMSTAIESPSSSKANSTSSPSSSPVIGNYPLPPLDRNYAEPKGELDVAKQLAKKPAYWSAQGWVHRAATVEAKPRIEDPETRARKFAEAKRDLLASAGRL
ncbi:hypothetical protein F5X99DRAFT_385123 [Biscogniauxia marginata]|nr:hypothetical protein F5X99DRAFT_385123 [Biscogniauxia marginata]